VDLGRGGGESLERTGEDATGHDDPADTDDDQRHQEDDLAYEPVGGTGGQSQGGVVEVL
jgi:hypothetical protein